MDDLQYIKESLAEMKKWHAEDEWSKGDKYLYILADRGYFDRLIDSYERIKQNEDIILQQNKKLRQQIHSFRCKTTYRVYEENLKLAEELALIKGEISG